MCLLSMAVHDFHFGWSAAFVGPSETDPPLIVDTNAPLPLALALQCFQSIAGPRQIPQAGGGVKLIQLARSSPGKA